MNRIYLPRKTVYSTFCLVLAIVVGGLSIGIAIINLLSLILGLGIFAAIPFTTFFVSGFSLFNDKRNIVGYLRPLLVFYVSAVLMIAGEWFKLYDGLSTTLNPAGAWGIFYGYIWGAVSSIVIRLIVIDSNYHSDVTANTSRNWKSIVKALVLAVGVGALILATWDKQPAPLLLDFMCSLGLGVATFVAFDDTNR